jgi:hypothetical protein
MKEARLLETERAELVSQGGLYMPRPIIVQPGDKYGMLVIERVFSEIHPEGSIRMCDCRCACGRKHTTRLASLRKGATQSCGCLGIAHRRAASTTHGLTGIPEHRSWKAANNRCYNERCKNYKYYGGRGITVCEQWRGENGFSNFLADMGLRPSPKHSLDRWPNQNGNYEKSNCRWATPMEQANNKRNNVIIVVEGVEITLTGLSRKTGINIETLTYRLKHFKIIHLTKVAGVAYA